VGEGFKDVVWVYGADNGGGPAYALLTLSSTMGINASGDIRVTVPYGDAYSADDLQPVAAWDFTESTNDIVGDTDLTLTGTAAIVDGVGLVLDGSGYAVTDATESTMIDDEITIVLEYKVANLTSGAMRVLSNKPEWGGNRGFEVESYPNLDQFSVWMGGPGAARIQYFELDTDYHQMVVTSKEGLTKIYVDGYIVNCGGTTANVVSSELPLYVGTSQGVIDDADYSEPFEGTIRNVAIYDRALTLSELVTVIPAAPRILKCHT